MTETPTVDNVVWAREQLTPRNTLVFHSNQLSVVIYHHCAFLQDTLSTHPMVLSLVSFAAFIHLTYRHFHILLLLTRSGSQNSGQHLTINLFHLTSVLPSDLPLRNHTTKDSQALESCGQDLLPGGVIPAVTCYLRKLKAIFFSLTYLCSFLPTSLASTDPDSLLPFRPHPSHFFKLLDKSSAELFFKNPKQVALIPLPSNLLLPITSLPKHYCSTLPTSAPTSTNRMSTSKPKNFELRGDLQILMTGTQSDCDLIAGDHKFHVHKAILASRGGCLKTLLSGEGRDEQVSF